MNRADGCTACPGLLCQADTTTCSLAYRHVSLTRAVLLDRGGEGEKDISEEIWCPGLMPAAAAAAASALSQGGRFSG